MLKQGLLAINAKKITIYQFPSYNAIWIAEVKNNYNYSYKKRIPVEIKNLNASKQQFNIVNYAKQAINAQNAKNLIM